MTLVRQSLGDLPMVEDEMRSAEEAEEGGAVADAEMKASVCPFTPHPFCPSLPPQSKAPPKTGNRPVRLIVGMDTR